MLISICFSSCMNKTVVAEVNFTHGTTRVKQLSQCLLWIFEMSFPWRIEIQIWIDGDRSPAPHRSMQTSRRRTFHLILKCSLRKSIKEWWKYRGVGFISKFMPTLAFYLSAKTKCQLGTEPSSSACTRSLDMFYSFWGAFEYYHSLGWHWHWHSQRTKSS